MAAAVKSIEKLQVTIATSSTSGTDTVAGTPTMANCIPFTSTYITTANGPAFDEYNTKTDFLTSPDRVQVSRYTGSASSALAAEVTLVEFNSDEVNVYSGTTTMTTGEYSKVVSSPFGSPVSLTKAFLYFTYTSDDSGGDYYEEHSLRGRITGTNELTFDQAYTGSGTAMSIEWYVAEAKTTAWDVDAVDISITDTNSTGTDTFTAVTTAKTFVLGSATSKDQTDPDGVWDAICDVRLTNTTTVTADRGEGNDGQIDWSGFIVELGDSGANVYRGNAIIDDTSPITTSSFTAVTQADSMVHQAGFMGGCSAGDHQGASSALVPPTYNRWTFASDTTAQAHHATDASGDGNASWEVIEWEVDAGSPVTRRIMVIS